MDKPHNDNHLKTILADTCYTDLSANRAMGKAYVRSRLYTAQTGINPLVVAAQPLLSFLDRLSAYTILSEPQTIRQDLLHELAAFQAHAKTFDYAEDLLIAARFVLCVTIDDRLMNLPWQNHQRWQEYQLLPQLEKRQQSSTEALFTLLERVKQTPGIYIDLIELIYLCLANGFSEHPQWNEIIDSIYDIIHEQRGDSNLALFSHPAEVAELTVNSTTTRPRYLNISPLVVLSLCLLTLTGLFFILDYILGLSSQSLLQKIQYLTQQLQLDSYSL